jgi:hypothetical protein
VTVGAKQDAGEIVDGAGRTVVAGNPLRILEGQRTGVHWYFQMSMQQAARRICEIHMQNDRGGGSLGDRVSAGQEEQGDAKDGAQTAFLHPMIIS